jgi:hypothetical protein
MRSRAAAQVQYDKAMQMCSYAVGDRVLIYHTPGETESGRKLRVPWIGPYRITERHSAVGYPAVSGLEGRTARVHVNRLKAGPDGREVDTSEPEQGLWPDVRRVLRGVLGKRMVRDGVEYQVRRAGRNGFMWVGALALGSSILKPVVQHIKRVNSEVCPRQIYYPRSITPFRHVAGACRSEF